MSEDLRELAAIQRMMDNVDEFGTVFEPERKLPPLAERVYAYLATAQESLCDQLNSLAKRVLEMCQVRSWSLHWTARGVYLHLESSELIEAVRGKKLDGRTKHQAVREEAADVLIVLMSITQSEGVPWSEVELTASRRVADLIATADKPYPGESRK